jgi:hypothetical protein
MGRPAKGIGSQFSEPVLSAIHQYRIAHQGWGAKTIRTELLLDGRFSQSFLPSLTTIANYLRAKGLVKIYEPNRPLANVMLFNLTKAHQQWQIDDMGPESYPSVGFVGMINVKDVFSKVYVQTFPVTLEHTRCHPNMSDYQCALRLGFIEFGLPDAIQADHGSNFYENKSKSPFPTTLHLWLVALGIDFSWSRTHRPTDQGSVERSHWTTFNQIQRSQSFKNWQELKEFCDQRRYKLNHHLICDTLKKAPLVAFPEAIHSKKYFNPLTEHLTIDLQKVFSFLAKGEWFRKVSSAKTISLAGQVYYLTNSKPNQKIRITFDSDSKELFFHDDNELFLKLPIKGISIEKLMGYGFEQIAIPNVQLEIPFNWNQIKVSTTLLYSD